MGELDKFTDEYFINALKSTKLLKDVTRNRYITYFNTMQTELWDGSKKSILWIVMHPELFIDALTKWGATKKGKVYDTLSTSTLRSYPATIIGTISKHIDLQEIMPNILQEWKNVGNKLDEPDYDRRMEGRMNARQEKAYIPWEHIIAIRDRLPEGMDRLLISMYTMIPPRRNDYYQLKIFEDKPPSDDYDGNYIVLGDINQIVINESKTSNKYGTVITNIPPELLDQIRSSIDKYPREYLFQSDTGAIYTRVHSNKVFNTVFKRVFKNKGFSITMFRHSYVTYLKVDNLPIAKRKLIAKNMGHSCLRQKEYEFRDQS